MGTRGLRASGLIFFVGGGTPSPELRWRGSVVVVTRMVVAAPAPEGRGRAVVRVMMVASRSKERMILKGSGQVIPEGIWWAI